MKKNLLFLMPFLGCTVLAFAQPVNQAAIMNRLHHSNRSKLVKACLNTKGNSVNKQTATAERVKTLSTYTIDQSMQNLVLNDSTWYKYSGTRGSKFDYNNFDALSEGPTPDLACDSSINYSDQGSGIVLSGGEAATYATGSKRSSYFELEADASNTKLENNMGHFYKYDGSGNVSIAYDAYWNSSNSWDTNSRTIYGYNAQNKVTADSQYDYFSTNWTQKNLYNYDASGNLLQQLSFSWSGSKWDSSDRVINTYNANNMLVTSLSQHYSTKWENQSKDSFGYAGSSDLYTYNLTQTWDQNTKAWQNDYREKRTLNTASLPDTMISENWDSQSTTWETESVIKLHYNTNNNPVMANIYVSFGGTTLEVAEFVITYEPVDGTAVKDLSKTYTAAVYPNPAAEMVKITWKDKIAGNIKLSVVNTIGQLVYSADQPMLQTNTVSLSGLSAGTYMLRVNDASGNVLCSQQIMKQ